MDSKTRVLDAMYGRKTDHVPVSWYTHFPDQTDNTVAEQIRWANSTDMDMLCIETDGYMEWDCGKTPIKTPEALRRMKPHKKDDPYIEGQVDRAKRIAEGLPDRAVTYMLFTPFGTIKHSLNSPNQEWEVMDLLRADPDAVRHAMEVIEEDNFTLIERLRKETELTGLFVSMQNCEQDRFEKEEYISLLSPYDKRLIAAVNSAFPKEQNIVHLCSWRGIPNNIEIWQAYDYSTVNWAVSIETGLGLKEGRTFFHEGSILMGGFDNRPEGVLYRGSEEEIKAETKRLIESAGKDRLILCSDCSVQKDTPDEHLRWVAEAAREI
jgi:uroporphyrinogen decarboxylase